MVISIPDDDNFFTKIQLGDLPKNWRTMGAYSSLQEIGNNWYITNKSLILQVPSVVIPQEFNLIINVNHPDFNSGNVSLASNEDYFWDDRLFDK